LSPWDESLHWQKERICDEAHPCDPHRPDVIDDTHEHLITPAGVRGEPTRHLAALFGLNAYIQHDLIQCGL
jgi:hypothetical protein